MQKKGQGKKQLALQNKIINAKEKDAVASESVEETTIDSTLSKWKSTSSSKSKIDLNNKKKQFFKKLRRRKWKFKGAKSIRSIKEKRS